MIEQLSKYLINENKPKGESRWGWGAGSQPEALRFYLDKKVEIIAEYQDDDYQGECITLLYVDDLYFLWKDYFGSCSGCDALEGCNGYEYIKDTLTSIKEFNTLNEVKYYLKAESDKEDYSYRKDIRLKLLELLK